jgi:hypothetical protein
MRVSSSCNPVALPGRQAADIACRIDGVNLIDTTITITDKYHDESFQLIIYRSIKKKIIRKRASVQLLFYKALKKTFLQDRSMRRFCHNKDM